SAGFANVETPRNQWGPYRRGFAARPKSLLLAVGAVAAGAKPAARAYGHVRGYIREVEARSVHRAVGVQGVAGKQERGPDDVVRAARSAPRLRLGNEQVARAVVELDDLAHQRLGLPEGVVDGPERAGMAGTRQEEAGQREVLGQPAGRVRAQEAEGN